MYDGEPIEGELVEQQDRSALTPISNQPMQRMQTAYATAVAVQRPRQIDKIKNALLQEAALAGQSFYYGWGAGKDRIEGPSVDLAMALARLWGNCALEMLPVQETTDAWIFTAIFVDLETGFTLPRQFRQSKGWVVHGKMDANRKDDVRFQIGQSKALRNVVLNALPGGLIKAAMEKAKEGIRDSMDKWIKSKNIVEVTEILLRELAKLGVKEDVALGKVGVAKREALKIDELIVLKTDLDAMRRGEEHAENLFPALKPSEQKPDNGAEIKDLINGKAKQEEPKTETKPSEPEKQQEPTKAAGTGDGSPSLSEEDKARRQDFVLNMQESIASASTVLELAGLEELVQKAQADIGEMPTIMAAIRKKKAGLEQPAAAGDKKTKRTF
jgi:hypothetical protein